MSIDLSIWDLGSDPVECDVIDAAIEHDHPYF
jgi:hypothetical protein